MSIGTLLAIPAASGLFRRAILQSGAAHSNISPAAAGRVASRLLDLAEVTPGDWDALRVMPVQRLVQLAAQVGMAEAAGLLGDEAAFPFGFQPVIDEVTLSARAVDLVAAGSAADVKLIIGTNAEEWRLVRWGFPAAVEALIPEPDVTSIFAATGRPAEEVLKVYAASHPGQSMRELLCAVQTDQMFTIPAARLAEAQLRHNPAVWTYRFSWPTPVAGGKLGACHTMELPFAFDELDESKVFVGANPPRDLAAAMHGSWVRFASTGDPNGTGLPLWPPYETGARQVMDFSTISTVVTDPNGEERRLWTGLM